MPKYIYIPADGAGMYVYECVYVYAHRCIHNQNMDATAGKRAVKSNKASDDDDDMATVDDDINDSDGEDEDDSSDSSVSSTTQSSTPQRQ